MSLTFAVLSLVSLLVQRPADVVRWSAAAPGSVAPGGTATLTVTAKVQSGWKLYAIDQPADGPTPLKFAVAKDSGFQIAAARIVAPKAKVQADPTFGVRTHYYETEATFSVPVTVPATAAPAAVPLEVTFQACGQDICLRPFTQKLQVAVSVSR